jgi:uncharacterized membrane protein
MIHSLFERRRFADRLAREVKLVPPHFASLIKRHITSSFVLWLGASLVLAQSEIETEAGFGQIA